MLPSSSKIIRKRKRDRVWEPANQVIANHNRSVFEFAILPQTLWLDFLTLVTIPLSPGLPRTRRGGGSGRGKAPFSRARSETADQASCHDSAGAKTRILFEMVNRNLLRTYDLPETELQQQLHEAFYQEETGNDIDSWLPVEEQEFEVNKVVKGRVLNIVGDDVVVDVGYK